MEKLSVLGLAVLFALTTGGAAKEQVPPNGESAPLVLVRIIPMPDVQGRFNHSTVDAEALTPDSIYLEGDLVEEGCFSKKL
jgi:hypothetical protein